MVSDGCHRSAHRRGGVGGLEGGFSHKIVLGGLGKLLLGSISKVRVCEVVSRAVVCGRIAS